ncbi:HAD family hydrolase [Halobaculum gomorrense]|uniref:2-haloacid dehalogenase/putative hydrolase of the HAD superfamily n=1 Tax=Halobaculum gomorrense TaxID=43928 RepID=A0A1M5TTT9_9EURY|nr:HAD family hydrolase [Halobaculum gomorrense]SHH54192.1 2-haloacid dehalogenase/putative hydrolase of the HAD superfamily [Halobaculum gomorrense]
MREDAGPPRLVSPLADAGGITFDLDDTLVSYRRLPGEVLAAAFGTVGVDSVFPVEAYYDRFAEFNDRTDSMPELRRACFAALCAERDRDPDLGRAVADAFAAERDHANVAWRPGARDLLDALDARGVSYAVVTNGPPDAQAAKVRAVGLDDRAVAVVFAGHDAPAKPDIGAFEAGLLALGIAAGDAVHVGDSPESDAAGALEAGMDAVLVGDREPTPPGAVRVPSLAVLLDPTVDDPRN